VPDVEDPWNEFAVLYGPPERTVVKLESLIVHVVSVGYESVDISTVAVWQVLQSAKQVPTVSAPSHIPLPQQLGKVPPSWQIPLTPQTLSVHPTERQSVSTVHCVAKLVRQTPRVLT